MTVRIVTAIDFETDNPAEAYAMLYETNITFESTDEWYDSAGNAIPAAEVQRIRMEVFEQRRAT